MELGSQKLYLRREAKWSLCILGSGYFLSHLGLFLLKPFPLVNFCFSGMHLLTFTFFTHQYPLSNSTAFFCRTFSIYLCNFISGFWDSSEMAALSFFTALLPLFIRAVVAWIELVTSHSLKNQPVHSSNTIPSSLLVLADVYSGHRWYVAVQCVVLGLILRDLVTIHVFSQHITRCVWYICL